MPQLLTHRVVLVAVEAGLEPALRDALARRGAAVAARHAHVPADDEDGPALYVAQLAPADLAALCAAQPGRPVVALLPPGAGLADVVAAQRAGAAQVVPLPLSADDFLAALDGVAQQFGPATPEGKVVAVCGVGGGCGATTLALNLAWEMGKSGRLVVELARQMGSLATYLDVEPAVTSLDLLIDPDRLTPAGVRQALAAVAPGLDALVGPFHESRPLSPSPRQVQQLVRVCRRLASLVVLDVPCSYDDVQFATLAAADEVVLVGVQTVASVRTLKLVRDALRREEGIRSIRLVVNRYEPSLTGFTADRLAELLEVPRVLTVANDYAAVTAAATHGKPLALAVPHSAALAGVRALAADFAGAPAAPPGDRLGRAMGRPQSPRAVRVLHVEDDAVTHQAMRLHLSAMKEFSFEVTQASSEAQAAEAFAAKPFDVVLLDYHLEQGNGLNCLRQLRALDAMVPVVVVSSVAQPEVAAELLAAGADDFLSKENVNGPAVARALSKAVERVGALGVRVEPVGRRARPDDAELLTGADEIRASVLPRRPSAGQIQRLVDLVCAELDRGGAVPRKALLGVFMRLFGGQ